MSRFTINFTAGFTMILPFISNSFKRQTTKTDDNDDEDNSHEDDEDKKQKRLLHLPCCRALHIAVTPNSQSAATAVQSQGHH